MKRIFLTCSIVGAVLAFNSCDYVSNAVPSVQEVPIDVVKKVLVEDYTGHKCGNCPAAGRALHALDSIDNKKSDLVIPMAVHAGFYAGINSTYPNDLRSTASTDYYDTFGFLTAGNPNGLVNRTGFGTASFIQAFSAWASTAQTINNYVQQPRAANTTIDSLSDFKIDIENSYDTVSGQLTCSVTVTVCRNVTGKYNLSVLITEDDIVGPQLDYSLSASQYPGQIYPNYVFDHVLRGALNTSWGETIISGTAKIKDYRKRTYAGYQLGSGWNYKKCHIIAFVYYSDTSVPNYYEIEQVETKAVY